MSTFRTPVSNSEGDYELPPAGMHPAVLIGIIDLGTHNQVYNGQSSEVRKLLFCWELVGEPNSKGETFVVSQDYTWSLNRKSKLRALVESWLAKGLDEGDFELGQFLGQSCLLSLAEGTSNSGKKFVEIAAIGPPPRGFIVPPASRTPFTFALAGWPSAVQDPPVPSWVPKLYGRLVLDEIKGSKEYLGLPSF
jgi:hypothetical protein